MDDARNVLQRLNAVRATLSYVQKDQKKIDGQYTATRYDDIVEHAHDLLVANGIMVVVEVVDGWTVDTDTGMFTGKKIPYTRWQGVIKSTFYNVDRPSDFIVASAPAFGLDYGDKGPGKAHTYGAKSNLIKTLFLVTGDHEEERVETKAEQEAGAVATIGPEKIKNFCESVAASTTIEQARDVWMQAAAFIKANGANPLDLKPITDAGSKRTGELSTAKAEAKAAKK